MNWREFQRSQKVAEVDHRFVSYVDRGAGEPVVMLHGIPTWGYLWDNLSARLANSRRVLAPDLPGFGYSDRSDRFDRSIAHQAEYIDRWMERVGVERAAFVGHDIGGGTALRLATLFPRRVSRLCLMNSVCYDSWPIEAMLQFGHPATYHKLSAASAQSALKQNFKNGMETSPDDELLEGLLAPCATEVGKLSLIRDAAALNTNLTAEITPLLSRIDVPVLVLWGEDDTHQPIKYGERLAADIPYARLVRIQKARHFVMLDQPDRVASEVASFLAAE